MYPRLTFLAPAPELDAIFGGARITRVPALPFSVWPDSAEWAMETPNFLYICAMKQGPSGNTVDEITIIIYML